VFVKNLLKFITRLVFRRGWYIYINILTLPPPPKFRSKYWSTIRRFRRTTRLYDIASIENDWVIVRVVKRTCRDGCPDFCLVTIFGSFYRGKNPGTSLIEILFNRLSWTRVKKNKCRRRCTLLTISNFWKSTLISLAFELSD